jgi:hypothetical protein
MQLQNTYYYYKSLFSKEQCESLINKGLNQINENLKKGENVYGTVYGGAHKGSNNQFIAARLDQTTEELLEKNKNYDEKKYYIRDSKVTFFVDNLVTEIVDKAVKTANINNGWNWQYDTFEPCQFTVYEPGGFYGWHSDGDSDHFGKYKRIVPGVTNKNNKGKYTYDNNLVGKVRKLSVTINLSPSNSYEGGMLKFDNGPHSTKRFHVCEEIKEQGSMIIFPSFLYHQVTPITKGTRYSLVIWICGNPFI